MEKNITVKTSGPKDTEFRIVRTPIMQTINWLCSFGVHIEEFQLFISDSILSLCFSTLVSLHLPTETYSNSS